VIVVDASAVIEVLLNTRAAARVAERLFGGRETLHVPHLLDLEVAQALRRYVLAGDLDGERGEEALDDLCDLPLRRYPHEPFLGRIWELRRNVTAYDAAYLALAEALGAPCLTRDAKLADASGHRARIVLIR
jgi:predicted nucleic acid-binding protein